MNLWYFLATFFYIGKLPIAPGTWASLITLFIWAFLPENFLLNFFIIFILSIIALISSNKVSIYLSNKDPSEVVIDEVIGMSLALFIIPFSLINYLLIFLLFRIFDILKPSFIYRLQSLPNGWGIILDDIFAGIFASILGKSIISIL